LLPPLTVAAHSGELVVSIVVSSEIVNGWVGADVRQMCKRPVPKHTCASGLTSGPVPTLASNEPPASQIDCALQLSPLGRSPPGPQAGWL
jgi:hypothetical protein